MYARALPEDVVNVCSKMLRMWEVQLRQVVKNGRRQTSPQRPAYSHCAKKRPDSEMQRKTQYNAKGKKYYKHTFPEEKWVQKKVKGKKRLTKNILKNLAKKKINLEIYLFAFGTHICLQCYVASVGLYKSTLVVKYSFIHPFINSFVSHSHVKQFSRGTKQHWKNYNVWFWI